MACKRVLVLPSGAPVRFGKHMEHTGKVMEAHIGVKNAVSYTIAGWQDASYGVLRLESFELEPDDEDDMPPYIEVLLKTACKQIERPRAFMLTEVAYPAELKDPENADVPIASPPPIDVEFELPAPDLTELADETQ